MTLIERLRAHLERLPEPCAAPLEMAPYHAHLLRRLRELEDRDAGEARRLYGTHAARVERFVHHARAEICEQGLVPSDGSPEIETLTLLAMDRWLGLEGEVSSSVVDAALWGIVSGYRRANGAPPVDVRRYAFEIRLSRRRDRDMALARAGRIFLTLPGRDAVAWLLALEMAQSQSDNDPFRLSMTAAKEILAAGSWFIHYAGASPPEGPPDPPAIHQTVSRLEELGVINGKYEYYSEDHSVTPEGRAVLQDLTRDGESRWASLAAACIAEEQGMLIDELLPLALRLQRESAAEAGAREARLVAHEVRNALGPVQFALTRLVTLAVDAEAKRQLKRVEEGVMRLFHFVDDRLRMAEAIDQSDESFELDNAVRDLVSLEAAPDLDLAAGSAKVRGPRASVVATLHELVRNAHHANGARPVRVHISTERRNGHVALVVDDDGKGVPSDDRDRIFARGVSLRGGSGEGLALAKDVFERAMRGTIRCVESPLGGARFEVILPTASIPRIPR
jgi:signal transduction histidine kinase